MASMINRNTNTLEGTISDKRYFEFISKESWHCCR